jgi:hypothetical protein
MKHLNLGRVLLLALCICLAATLLTAFSPARSAYAATASPAACSNYNYSPGNFTLNVNYKVQWTTCKGNTMDLNMQYDGNFVLYVNGQAKWASNTSGLTAIGNYAYFEPNGALRVYDISTISGPYLAWSSGTGGKGARLSLQDDGNMVIYNASGAAIWATHTSGY